MDNIKAKNLFKEIEGKEINGMIIKELIDHGKSAAVFLGEKGEKKYAIKIFDNELVERYGVEIQKKRIEQELSLKNHGIINLVSIIDGGEYNIANIDYCYIIMEYVKGKNLKQYIKEQQSDIELSIILEIVNSLIITSEALLSRELPIAHRDIKPENIMITKDNKVILMDLGVIKIIGSPHFTNEDEKIFIGTLRYAPPEFLLGEESDSIEGWRSVNIYQIGTVLHDLITRKDIFDGCDPYAKLVLAIKEDQVLVRNDNYPYELLQLTRNMLIKQWKKRLEISSIERIKKTLITIAQTSNELNTNIHPDYFEEIKHLTLYWPQLIKQFLSLIFPDSHGNKPGIDIPIVL
ncbi:MAG: protein kinase [Brevinematales bacterium]|nr:protein kinase [Brevinematales bacterium]